MKDRKIGKDGEREVSQKFKVYSMTCSLFILIMTFYTCLNPHLTCSEYPPLIVSGRKEQRCWLSTYLLPFNRKQKMLSWTIYHCWHRLYENIFRVSKQSVLIGPVEMVIETKAGSTTTTISIDTILLLPFRFSSVGRTNPTKNNQLTTLTSYKRRSCIKLWFSVT